VVLTHRRDVLPVKTLINNELTRAFDIASNRDEPDPGKTERDEKKSVT